MSVADYPRSSLSISCVYYDTDISVFEKTLISIAEAVNYAKLSKTIEFFQLHLINNNPEKELIFQNCIEKYRNYLGDVVIHSGQGNIGYGRANNIAISITKCEYHLILNPDVITDKLAIRFGLDYLNHNSYVGMVAPSVKNANGEIEYLAKRFPSLLIILLRGFNNKYLNKFFEKKLSLYAYKDKIPSSTPVEIELASGCFMLCRTSILNKTGGFSEKYFLYFEDFDLSKKISSLGKICHLPQMEILHLGGNASKKNLKHVYLFLLSALRFFYSGKF